MPRSNKKKFPFKTPPKQPTIEATSGISYLLKIERKKMISRAIASGNNHGIQLVPGSENAGRGDCAFEAVVQNINDRACFPTKYHLPINQYRSIWVTDMANRTIDSPWNTLSHQQWMEGWRQMLVPGTYERGIFGDLMLPGIACGVRKILLIFNTNPDSPHDPIYVVNPAQFNVQTDTDIPIVLAYNLSHYESLHPSGEQDIEATINLVKEYEEGRYRFRRQDIPALTLISLKKDDKRNDHLVKSKQQKDINEYVHDRKTADYQNVNHNHEKKSKQSPEISKQQVK